MKKLIGILIAVALLLCACAQGSGDDNTVTRGKKDKFTPSGQKVESSIFGRNIKYDGFTPAENISLPIESADILDMLQIEKVLYFLTDGAVYTLNIESGESGKLFDTDATMFASHSDRIYTYVPESGKLSEYDLSGSVTNETAIEVTGVDSVLSFLVVDDYYVFYCYIPGTIMMEPHLFVYSRETEEFILSKKLMATRIYPYKGNKVLAVINDSPYLNAFDAESGKSERLATLVSADKRPGVVYCPKTDTVLVYCAPPGMTYNFSTVPMLDGNAPVCIYEYSLDDEDRIIHNRYYFETSQDTKFFISVYENIVSAVSTSDSEYRVFDYLNPPESITLLGSLYDQNVIYGFEKETGILLKIASADSEKRVLKLMAGDDDFDVFNTRSEYHNYVDSGAYVDLKGIESLNSRISSNVAADFIVNYDGKYFGVPICIANEYVKEGYSPDAQLHFSRIVLENTYLAQNVDVAEGRYSDPDGEKLYKMFKYINDNPDGGNKKLFGDDATILSADVYLLNPKSQNYDNAVRFLEYLFDVYSGDIPGVAPEYYLYPTLESTENYYAEWRCRALDIVGVIFDARKTILDKNGGFSNSELKKLAKETAAKVRMRMME